MNKNHVIAQVFANSPVDLRTLLRFVAYSIGLWLALWVVLLFCFAFFSLVIQVFSWNEPVMRIGASGHPYTDSRGISLIVAFMWSAPVAFIVSLIVSQVALLATAMTKKEQ